MIEYIPHRCSPWLYKKAECRLCVGACPEGCIKFEDNAVSIEEEICTHCGICTTVCPSGALTIKGFNDRDFWERLKDTSKDEVYVVITCSSGEKFKAVRLRKGSSFVMVPCVGNLKESHIIRLFLSGVKEVWLRSACKDCLSAQGRRVMMQSVNYARTFLQYFGIDGKIILSEEFPAEKKGKKIKPDKILPASHYSRRELFDIVRDKARTIRQWDVERDEEEDQPLPDADLPERRQILLEMFERLEEPKPAELRKDLFPVNQLQINNNCTLCKICDLFCPTGALDRVEDEERVRIEFNLSSCVGCYQCEELCPEDALYSVETIDLKSFLGRKRSILYQKEMALCPECEMPYLPTDGMNTCISCRKKVDMENAFFAMMGIGN